VFVFPTGDHSAQQSTDKFLDKKTIISIHDLQSTYTHQNNYNVYGMPFIGWIALNGGRSGVDQGSATTVNTSQRDSGRLICSNCSIHLGH
jgi:hypothetical protein